MAFRVFGLWLLLGQLASAAVVGVGMVASSVTATALATVTGGAVMTR